MSKLRLNLLSVLFYPVSRCTTAIVLCAAFSGSASETWSPYGGSLSGDRYVPNSSINRDSVGTLVEAWRYRSGDSTDETGYHGRSSNFKATPIVVRDKLVFSTGFNRVMAISPSSGSEIWRFDPEVDFSFSYSDMFTSKGVTASVKNQSADPKFCENRVFLGTIDARLIALDADTGKPCTEFGRNRTVDLSKGIRNYRRAHYSVTSPLTIVRNLIVVGLAIGDNDGVDLEPGVVRAFDVVTGKLIWSWDVIPRNEDDPGAASWEEQSRMKTGGGNVWSVMVAGPERDMVFPPTTSPSPDFYGGERVEDNEYTNSVVALKASTGEFIWGYQVLRHDLWDYDLAAQPLSFDHVDEKGSVRPSLAQATKMGFVFVLDRLTGTPLHLVEEVPVPKVMYLVRSRLEASDFPKLVLFNRLIGM